MIIEAMKMAVEMFDWLERRSIYQDCQMKETHEALRQAIAEAEKQEPVAFITNKRQRMNVEIKPSAFVWKSTVQDWEIPLYTHPPQRSEDTQPKRNVVSPREPLTDEQIAEISVECATVTPSDFYFARAIEAAHGITKELK